MWAFFAVVLLSTFGCKSDDAQPEQAIETIEEQPIQKVDQDYKNMYQSGMHKVGQDIPPGEYVLFADDDGGYFSINSTSKGTLDDIVSNDNFETNSIIVIKPGQYLELTDAFAVPIDEVKELDTSGEGMFKVGLHISSGEYKLSAIQDESGYYAVYSTAEHSLDDIVANDNFENSTYVTVSDGQYLLLNDCKITK